MEMKDLAFLESLNQKLIAELDASVALEKELRERIAELTAELGVEFMRVSSPKEKISYEWWEE